VTPDSWLASNALLSVDYNIILIRFPTEDAKDRALELLLGEYAFKSWRSGELLLPEDALPLLARENVPFTFEGVEGYERITEILKKPLRSVFNNLKSG